MTLGAPESAATATTRIPSVAVLGADALLAALPATPVQLAHACLLAGFQSVAPASWGDELIAAATLRVLDGHGQLPAIQCSCPYVAHRLLAAGTDLRPFLVSLVAPPVALARYLRAAYAPAKLRITFVGRCPGAADEAIDARLTPEELLAIFADRAIVLDEQPQVFDSVIPPDRRRFCSQPGGLPTPETLWSAGANNGGGGRTLVELHGDDLPVELAQHLLAGKPVLIDVAGKLGCVCSGAAPGIEPGQTRARVVAVEPPRAQSAVVDERVPVELELSLPASPRSAIDIVAPAPGGPARPVMPPGAGRLDDMPASDEIQRSDREERVRNLTAMPLSTDGPSSPTLAIGPRRHSPTRGITRPGVSGLPTARDAAGRQLPRTYVARRRPLTRGTRIGAMETPRGDDGARDAPAPEANTAVQEPLPTSEQSVPIAPPSPLMRESTPAPRTPAPPAGPGHVVGAGGLELAETRMPVRAAAPLRVEESGSEAVYRERAIELPVMPRSDAPKHEEPAVTPAPTGDRPLAQLLVFSLLISTIVLISAAVGVVVGRWMAQR